MNHLSKITGSLVLCFSCQTASLVNLSTLNDFTYESTLHCSIPIPSETSKFLQVEVTSIDSKNQLAHLELQRTGEVSSRITAPISESGIIEISLRTKEIIGITLDERPRIGHIDSNTFEAKAVPCVKLTASNSHSPNSKQAACKASGTPAEGWYQAGRIIQHSHTCKNETISCGKLPIEGWYVQKKVHRTFLEADNCAWLQDTPRCSSHNEIKGWYLGQRLIKQDSSCQNKEIECLEAGPQEGGWYSFARSSPQLLVATSCATNRNISYLSR